MEILKISSKSNPNSVAGAIAGLIKESQKAEMQAIGAGEYYLNSQTPNWKYQFGVCVNE